MPTFEPSNLTLKEKSSEVDSKEDLKEESESAEQAKKVAENVTVPEAEALASEKQIPAEDESSKKGLVEVSAADLLSASIPKSEGELVTGVEESLKKIVEVIVVTDSEEISATEESAEASILKEAREVIEKAENAIKMANAVVEADVAFTQQKSGSIIAGEDIKESNVESISIKDDTASRHEPVISQKKAVAESLQLETTEKETTQKEAQLRPSCLLVRSNEWIFEDPQKISDAMARLDEPYLYNGSDQTKRIDIPAPDFDYVPSHADYRIHKRADCFECSIDVSIFNWSNISLHVVGDKINLACRQERENTNGYEFHDLHYIFPIPVDATKDGISVCITTNRRLVVRMPIKTTEKSSDASK